VKMGIHNFNNHNKFKKYWIPASAGMTCPIF